MILMYLYRLAKRYSTIFIMCIGTCLTYAHYENVTSIPLYQSQVQIFISTPTPLVDLSELASGSNFGSQRVKSYSQLIMGPATLNPVIEKLKLDITWTQLSQQVSANAPLDTVLINLIVKNQDPNLAAEIANAIALQFQFTIQTVESVYSNSTENEKIPLKASIAKTAQPNYTPVSPRKILNYTLAIVFGFLIAFSYLALLFIFDQKVKNEAHIFGYPLIGVIRFSKEVQKNPYSIASKKNGARAENFRQLRSLIQFNLKNSGPQKQVILISSALPNEGKSVTAGGLAITYASTGAKVLLVDCDLRKPSQDNLFKLSGFKIAKTQSDNNLVSLLQNQKTPKPVAFSQLPSLKILVAGNSIQLITEPFSSARFHNLLKKFKSQFDVIILDSPPVLLVSDTMHLADISDVCLIVVKAGDTRVAQLGRCLRVLDRGERKADAIILNMVPNSKIADEYGYGYGYTQKSLTMNSSGMNGAYGYSYNNLGYAKQYPMYLSDDHNAEDNSRMVKLFYRLHISLNRFKNLVFGTKDYFINSKPSRKFFLIKKKDFDKNSTDIKELKDWEKKLREIRNRKSP